MITPSSVKTSILCLVKTCVFFAALQEFWRKSAKMYGSRKFPLAFFRVSVYNTSAGKINSMQSKILTYISRNVKGEVHSFLLGMYGNTTLEV